MFKLFIFLIIIHGILNHNEKILYSLLFKKYVNRPLCNNTIALKCFGMPSGHTEVATILSLYLYHLKYINIYNTILLISIFGFQRIVSKRHTWLQVFAGLTCGLLYSLYYNYINYNTLYVVIFALFLHFILTAISTSIVDSRVQKEPIPEWVDKSSYGMIEKKRKKSWFTKMISIYYNIFADFSAPFYSWSEIEKDMDVLIENIKKSGVKFDGVVGIKTGGAIISDYLGEKLNLPVYKVKLTDSDYNCNKKLINVVDYLLKRLLNKKNIKYTVCEPINENLEGKNIILIDEQIVFGNTINEANNYLLNEKKVKYVHICAPMIQKNRFRFNDLQVDYVRDELSIVFPWGYDN